MGSNGKAVPVNPVGDMFLSKKTEEATVVLKKTPFVSTPSPIVFSLGKSNAQYTNCLSVSLNGSPFLRVACNHPKNKTQVAKLSLQTLPPPHCNSIQFIVETSSPNGVSKWIRTTATTLDLKHFIFLGYKKSNGYSDVSIGYEDNGGNTDYDDLVFTMRIKDHILFELTHLNEPEFKKTPDVSMVPKMCLNIFLLKTKFFPSFIHMMNGLF